MLNVIMSGRLTSHLCETFYFRHVGIHVLHVTRNFKLRHHRQQPDQVFKSRIERQQFEGKDPCNVRWLVIIHICYRLESIHSRPSDK